MAVHLATSSDYLQRTTALLPASGDSTVCMWVNSGNPVSQTPYIILDDPGVYTDYAAMFITAASHFALEVTGPLTTTAGVASVSTWYHLAWVQTGTSQRFYVNGALIGSKTLNRAAVVNGFELLGNDTFSNGDISAAYCREWTTALTQAQILDEMQATTAVHTANLYMDCPFNGNVLDISGNGHDWTTVGSVTFVDPPSFPSNHTAATATPLTTTLPSTLTVDFGDGIVAWYSYTPITASPNMLGFWAFTDVSDHLETAAYTGSPSSLTLQASGTVLPMQLPMDVGTTWYFRLLETTNVPPPEDVVISTVPGPTGGWSAGDILVPFDAAAQRAAVLSAGSVNYSVKSFVNFPTCEQADVLSESGIILACGSDSGQFELFNADFTSITNVAPTTVGSTHVRAHQPSQTFYVGMAGSGGTHASVRTIDATGAYGATTWTLAIAGLSFMAANNDETVLYYTSSTAANTAIKRWDLTNNVALADFVSGVAGYQVYDIYVLSDDTILITTYNNATFDVKVRIYNAAGAVQHTYTATSHGSDVRVAAMIADTTSFLLWTHETGISTIDEITISSGAVAETQDQAEYESSVYSSLPKPTATPLSRFGLSNTCPILVLRTSVTPIPPGEPVTYLIRRERSWPHISSDELRQFFSKLQIVMETGNGLTAGSIDAPVQGQDPILELDWSDDGGHTFSNLHLIHCGRRGAYRTRAIKRRLGTARDRVYRIACSDPVSWTIISAAMDAMLGIH